MSLNKNIVIIGYGVGNTYFVSNAIHALLIGYVKWPMCPLFEVEEQRMPMIL